jgi:uncharacterized membrane protein
MEPQQNTSGNAPQQNSTPASTPAPASIAVHNNTLMGVLSYLGPLVIISYALAKNDPFVKFHVKQGLVVFAIEIALWIIGMIVPMFYIIISLVNLGTLILSILGIINVIQNKQEPLPVVGAYSKYFTF